MLARHIEAAHDVECAARLVLQLVQPGAAGADQRTRDAILELDPEGLALGLARDAAQVAQHVDGERLVGQHAPGALAGRALAGHDLAHAVGDVLARHLDQAERRDLDDVDLAAVLLELALQHLEHGVRFF